MKIKLLHIYWIDCSRPISNSTFFFISGFHVCVDLFLPIFSILLIFFSLFLCQYYDGFTHYSFRTSFNICQSCPHTSLFFSYSWHFAFHLNFNHCVKFYEKSCWDLVRMSLHLLMNEKDWAYLIFSFVNKTLLPSSQLEEHRHDFSMVSYISLILYMKH